MPKIRVEFRCDENGRIVALARDQDTGKESRAFIHLGSSRTDEETRAESDWLSQAVVFVGRLGDAGDYAFGSQLSVRAMGKPRNRPARQRIREASF